MKLTKEQRKEYYQWPFWLTFVFMIPLVYFGYIEKTQGIGNTLFWPFMITVIWNLQRYRRITGTKEDIEIKELAAGIRMILGFSLIPLIITTWDKSISEGGFWWGVFVAASILGLYIGEKIKRDLIVRESSQKAKSKKENEYNKAVLDNSE